jgi:hypothetical protein
MRLINLVLSCIGGAIFCVDEAHSATIHVPADYSTIYAALDAASSGDIVEVAPGTYDQFDTRPSWWYGGNVSAVGFLKDGSLCSLREGQLSRLCAWTQARQSR